jgi:hypothetical protein
VNACRDQVTEFGGGQGVPQSAIHAMVELVAANSPRLDVAAAFDPATIASIEAEVPQIT